MSSETRRSVYLNRAVSRRRLLQRTTALAVSAPALVTLLAACGADDEEPTATTAGAATPAAGDPTATTAPSGDATATTVPEEPTATSEAVEATPTTAVAETPTAGGGDTLLQLGQEIEPAQHEGGTALLGEPYDLSSTNGVIDPYSTAAGLIWEHLIELHRETGEPVGLLATAWEVSDDGLTWNVTIREGVTWHDGAPFVVEDVVLTYTALLTEETQAADYGYVTALMVSVEAADESTVTFVNNTPSVDFLQDYLYWYVIIPSHVWGEIPLAEWITHPGSTGDDPSMVIGTGPFMFVEWMGAQSTTFARYDGYWDGRPHLDEVILKIIEDTAAAATQLLSGDIDFFPEVDTGAVASFDTNTFTVIATPNGYIDALWPNLRPERTTLFEDVRVRQAIMYAIDREQLIEVADFGFGEIPVAFAPLGAWFIDADALTVAYAYDPEQAAALLDEAGWTLAESGIREKDGQPFSFVLLAASGDERRITRATIIQEQLRAIGLEAELQVETSDVWAEMFYPSEGQSDFELSVGVINIASPEQAFYWASDGQTNNSGYDNPEIDELYIEARAEFDRERRIELYTQANNILLEDLPALPLSLTQLVGINNKRLHNIVHPAQTGGHFNAQYWWVDA
jgi:peptide/nickel transport system substrate-binding protein